MITIPANTIFKPLAPTFALQSTEATTISESVDGVNFTTQESAFDGAQIFSDYTTGVLLKCDKQVVCTVPCDIVETVTITATATNCLIEGIGPNRSLTVAKGSAVALRVLPQSGFRFTGWTDGDESTMKVIVAESNVTIGAVCTAI